MNSTKRCKQLMVAETRLDFGRQVRKSRVAKRLSQKKLGELLGVSQQAVSQYEAGNYISQDVANAIADVLGIKRVMFMGVVEPNRKGEVRHSAVTASKQCVRKELDFTTFIKMLNDAAFSGYAVARKDEGVTKFLMQDDSWGDKLTPSLKRFKTAQDVANVVKKYGDAVAFYAEFAFTPIVGNRYDLRKE